MEMIIPHSLLMTSQEIAELTGKEHKNVCADIRKMLVDLEEDALKFQRIYRDSLNRSQTEFLLDRELTDTLLTGYSAVLRRKVIARWRELESESTPAIKTPASFGAALRLAAEQQETIEQQAAQLIAAAPAVAFVDSYVNSTGLKGFRQVCKLLGANEAQFREFLKRKKIMYQLGGEWTPNADHLNTGRFAVKAGTSDLNGHAFNSARFTPKGVSWVAGEWAKWKLEQNVEVHS